MSFNFFANSSAQNTPFPSPAGTFDYYADSPMKTMTSSESGTFDYYANRESDNQSRLDHINNFISKIYGAIPAPFSSILPSAQVNPLELQTEQESKQKEQASPTISELMESVRDITSDSPHSSEDEYYENSGLNDVLTLRQAVSKTISMVETNFPGLLKPTSPEDTPIATAPTVVYTRIKKNYSTRFTFSKQHIELSEHGSLANRY